MKGIFTDEGAEKLWNVLKFLTARPEVHDQGSWLTLPTAETLPTEARNWSCGTQACVAGWLCLKDGWAPYFTAQDYAYSGADGEPCQCADCERIRSGNSPVKINQVIAKDGNRRGISALAAEILIGPEPYYPEDDEEGYEDLRSLHREHDDHLSFVNQLFQATNSLEGLWRQAHRHSHGYITVPDILPCGNTEQEDDDYNDED